MQEILGTSVNKIDVLVVVLVQLDLGLHCGLQNNHIMYC